MSARIEVNSNENDVIFRWQLDLRVLLFVQWKFKLQSITKIFNNFFLWFYKQRLNICNSQKCFHQKNIKNEHDVLQRQIKKYK